MKKTLFLMILLVASIAEAKVKLPKVLGDNMVLQRETNVNLWGEATPNKVVTITTSWNNKKYSVKADSNGEWLKSVETTKAGGPYTITISDGEKLVLSNILLGEVWICSGQSNMEMPVKGFNSQHVKGAADAMFESLEYPDIRLFTVKKNPLKEEPQKDCLGGEWFVSDPKSVANFSATAYFFGKALYKALKVPVGLITTNWGGSNIETWMTKKSIESIPGLKNMGNVFKNEKPNWKVQSLYNGMIAPITNYVAKGFIWYQGESNRGMYYNYAALMKKMIELWRTDWKNEQMPFYMVELAPYNYDSADGRSLPLTIEAQHKAVAETSKCGCATTIDIGHPICIHPCDKPEVGKRLAYLALTNDYGVKGLPQQMKIKSIEYKDGSALISFEKGDMNNLCMLTADGFIGYEGFELAGADKKFYPAEANPVWGKNSIKVKCDKVASPVALRYAFTNYHKGNVKSVFGLPLSPFRTDNWEVSNDDIYPPKK